MIANRASFIVLTLSLYFNDAAAAEPPIYSPDLVGRFCEARTLQCCSGRQDECSAPILGTMCYCDDFCNRTRNEDCCPDFWTFCKGIQIPEPLVQRREYTFDFEKSTISRPARRTCSRGCDQEKFRRKKKTHLLIFKFLNQVPQILRLPGRFKKKEKKFFFLIF